jgi:hypothetical protein
MVTNSKISRHGKLVLTIQVAESAVWLHNTFGADGWVYLSNFSCSFLLPVIYKINFLRWPVLQVVVRPVQFNPCWFA